VDDRADALFDLPGEQFVAARDALAKALPKDERAAVKALRRPSKLAEEVNHAVRARGADDVLAAADALRGGDVRGGSKALDAAIRALRVSAEAALGVRVAALDDAFREDLRAGRLQALPEGGGFGFGDVVLQEREPAAPAKAAKPAAKGAAKPAAKGAAEPQAKAAKGATEVAAPKDPTAAERREAERRTKAQARERERARKAAERELAAAEAEAQDAADALAEAQAAARAAQERLSAAREALDALPEV
jgi:flagellar biosynthesis GTPase FlhF